MNSSKHSRKYFASNKWKQCRQKCTIHVCIFHLFDAYRYETLVSVMTSVFIHKICCYLSIYIIWLCSTEIIIVERQIIELGNFPNYIT